MHLGLIGGHGRDLFLDNIGDSLEHMGHRVTYLSRRLRDQGGGLARRIAKFGSSALPRLDDLYHARLARAAHEHECDAVISVQGTLSPYVVTALRRERIPAALWFPDCVANIGRQRMFMAPYTALFFKDPLLVRRLRDVLGLPAWYLPEACNPRWHRPVGEAGTEPLIAVVGNTYPSRLLLLRRLHEAGIPLVIYGGPTARWARELVPPGLHTGRLVVCEEKARVFRGAAAVLNNLHPAEMHGVNCRLFEAAGSGAAVLCERRPVLNDLFDTDSEVVPFDSFDELVARARDLLADRQHTAKIGDAASARAHSQHTYEHRLPSILERLT